MPYLADLYYQAYQANDPNRKTLILIHGAGGDHLSWPTQLRRLSGYRVYTPDLPGHGKSRGHGLQRIPAYGETVLEWIRELRLPKAILAGHSMGGAVGLWIAINHPELLHGLVLMSTGATLPVNLSLIEELATQTGFPTAVDNITRWSFGSKIEPGLVENAKRQMLKLRPSVLAGDFRACDRVDQSEELDQVQIPTKVLVGDEDKMTPLRYAEELAAGIKGADLEVIPGSGHMLPLEQPDVVARRVRGFMDKVLKV
ncbi:MAG: alpha/beta hydrolase [Anaerolineales bacterium]|nr:alpha/beta hydrolase [Anaerolineales bacterium]